MRYKLALFDVDSTLTSTEGIDLLARHSPHAAKVTRITELAMAGEIDFDSALLERVSLLKDLDERIIEFAIEETKISPQAFEVVTEMKSQGMKIGVVSGGFREIIDSVFDSWPFDLVVAHTLGKHDGILTGEVQGPIINRSTKAAVLRDFARSEGIALENTIAIGDGSNDIEMIQAAGIGIAYRGKKALRDVADIQIENLEEILKYL